eukprot:scaffold313592_cov27-Tisochrysis_lutea.AAC.2
MMRQIRTLENRLDKAQIKYNEAQSIRKTYDQIVKRLKDERVSFDNQLAAIETTLQAKEHDFEELLLMSHDAAHARDVAKAELSKLQSTIEAERKARGKELTDRQNAVKARRELNQRMEERERIRREILSEGSRETERDAEDTLTSGSRSNAADATMIQSERAVVGAYEAAFRRIRESTGLTDVNEVIQKFLTQETTRANLEKLTKEAQARLEALGNERVATKSAVDEMKYAGGLGPGSRQEMEGAERKHQEVVATLERIKARHARTSKAFVDVRVGIEHMADKLEPVRLDRVDGTGNATLSDENVVEVMQVCEAKLVRLAELYASSIPDGGGRAPSGPSGDSFAETTGTYNLRVHLSAEEEEEEDDDDDDDMDGEIPDRMMVKKQHDILMDKANAKGRRRKKRFDGGKAAPAGKPGLA